MTPERWRRIEAIYAELEPIPASERPPVLENLCAGDLELRREIEQLLTSDGATAHLIEHLVAGQAASLGEAPPFQDRFGPYRIVRRIGQGGMGAVYEAERTGAFHKRVALKIIKQEMDSEFARVRFLQERQLLATLDHPYIARLLDGGETEQGSPYLVLEFVDGEPIHRYCERLDRTARLRLFLKVCEAVEYAHRNLVIHRDLKPANILVTPAAEPKLLDFGIAKLLESGATQTLTGFHALTPDYASPEQVKGEAIRTASDVYSLGVVLYELLTGRRPYQVPASSPVEIHKAVCLTEPLAPQLGEDLDNILLMALRKEPERRYGSVEQFAADIQRTLDNRPVIARPDTLRYRSAKFIRRNRLPLAAVTAVIAALSGGVVASQYQARRAERRFQEVRRLARSFLALDAQIQNLPGSTPVRENIVHTALAYFEGLSREAAGDPDLLKELAAGYVAVGDVQGNSFVSNLGKLGEAEATFEKARQIGEALLARNPTDPETLELLSGVALRIGDVHSRHADHDGAVRNYSRCIGLAEPLWAAGRRPYAVLYAAYTRMSSEQLRQANPPGAIEYATKGLHVAEEWEAAKPGEAAESALYRAHEIYSQAIRIHGDVPGSIEHANLATKFALDLYQKHPGNTSYAFQLVYAWCGIGSGPGGGGLPFDVYDFAGPMPDVPRARALADEIARADPANVNARNVVAVSSLAWARLIRSTDPLQAIGFYRKAIEADMTLAAADPNTLVFHTNIAYIRTNLAATLSKIGKYQEALAALAAALPEQERFESVRQGSLGLIDNLLIRADIRQLQGDPADARLNLERALARQQARWQTHQNDLLETYEMSAVYEGWGQWAERQRDWSQARKWYQKSLDLWTAWPQRGVSSFYDQAHARQAARKINSLNRGSIPRRIAPIPGEG